MMNRRSVLWGALSLAVSLGRLRRKPPRQPDVLAGWNHQLTPAAAAQAAAAKHRAKQPTGGYGKLGKGDIFWSVMWPYMYTVGRAEGTVGNHSGISPYQVIYTYDRFESFDDHPRRAHPILDADGRPTGKVSDAAGWPQFISTTWDETVAANAFWYDGPAFQPANQDLGFLYLHRDTGGHAALMAGVHVDPPTQRLTVAYKAFIAAITADSQQWASLPGANIGAATGQHTRPRWWLWTQFQWALWKQMGYRRRIIHPIGTDKPLTSPMGYQAWRGAIHWGQDFASEQGTAIVAPEDGIVTLTGYEPKGGYYLRFRPETQPELAVIFRHCLGQSLVEPHTPIRAGDLIGRTGKQRSVHHRPPCPHRGHCRWPAHQPALLPGDGDMVLSHKPIYLALFSLTLLAVIAGSSAVLALVGQGRDVMIFAVGVAVGMSLVSALSLELWRLSCAQLVAMQETIIQAISAMRMGAINPRWFFSQYRGPAFSPAPQNATDIQLELECRRLLDRTHQLLENTVGDDGRCRYCHHWAGHQEDCPVPAAQLLYQAGKEKRVPWREYKKTLPITVV